MAPATSAPTGQRRPRPQPDAPRATDIALMTFTSGTVGAPKAIPRSHGFMAAQRQAIAPLLDPVHGAENKVRDAGTIWHRTDLQDIWTIRAGSGFWGAWGPRSPCRRARPFPFRSRSRPNAGPASRAAR
ncbi:MAG: AMP-binding protein [Candidatus Saccharibacteria bacterium]|nr:AMP-binding protein [Pseudorhodobacter sp.]